MAQPATTLDPLEIQNQQLQALQALVSSMAALNHLAEMSSKLDRVIQENQNLVDENRKLNAKIDTLNKKVDGLQQQLSIVNLPVKTKHFTTAFSDKNFNQTVFNGEGAAMIKTLKEEVATWVSQNPTVRVIREIPSFDTKIDVNTVNAWLTSGWAQILVQYTE